MWHNGELELDTSAYSQGLAHLLDSAMERVAERRSSHVAEADILSVLLSIRTDVSEFMALDAFARQELLDAAALLRNHMATGVRISDCLSGFDVVSESGVADVNPFEYVNWSAPLAVIVNKLLPGSPIVDLLGALLDCLDSLADGDLISGLFDTAALSSALNATDSLKLFTDEESEDPPIDATAFSPRAFHQINQALRQAARVGSSQCSVAELFTAMATSCDSYCELILRQSGASLTGGNWTSYVASLSAAHASPLPSQKSSLSASLITVLESALRHGAATGQSAVGERELLASVVELADSRTTHLLQDVLVASPEVIVELLREVPEPVIIEPRLPTDLGTVRNATLTAKAGIPRPELVSAMIRVFFRQTKRTVLLHGERGTGRSALADLLAVELREKTYAALSHTQVIVFDLGMLDGEEYTRTAERVLAFMDSQPERIYVVEGFGDYFVENMAACARRLARAAFRLAIIVDPMERAALRAGSEVLIEVLDEIEVPEPAAGLVSQIIDQASPQIAAQYGVTFAQDVPGQTIRMTRDFLLAQRFPAKAINLLDSVAADVAAAAEMTASADRTVTRKSLATRIATVTGLPEETILGTGVDRDYVDLLSTNLVGQDIAVAKVAGRLDLIQKGMVDKTAPAAVYIFAGLSGTGKTELAKQIAGVYSASHSLITFPMENFTEAHSVAGLLGSPPGYVGYESGGALVNALDRDPYSVVLLDEVEKAHPTIWDPFLHLFDEGTITDTRGVTASGTKAFFIMTSNIGQYEIAEMISRGAGPEEIEDSVMALLPKFQHRIAQQPCFRPEFLGRVMRRGGVVAFNALSLEALKGIARHGFSKIAATYANVHEGRLVCDDEVLDMLAGLIYEENERIIKAGRPGYLGARRLDQLLDQYISNKVATKLRQIAHAPLVRVVLDGSQSEIVPVFSDADAQELLAERHRRLLDRVERRFSTIVTAPDDAFTALPEAELLRLDRLLAEVGAVL